MLAGIQLNYLTGIQCCVQRIIVILLNFCGESYSMLGVEVDSFSSIVHCLMIGWRLSMRTFADRYVSTEKSMAFYGFIMG